MISTAASQCPTASSHAITFMAPHRRPQPQVAEHALGFGRRAGQAVVHRQLRDVGLDAVRVRGLDGLGGAQVRALLARQRQLVVERLAHQRVGEGIGGDAAVA